MKSFMHYVLAVFFCLCVTVSMPSRADDNGKETLAEKELMIQGLFETWNKALATGDPNVVAGLYAEDAVLLPTVSNKVRDNHEEIKDYFTHFLELKPQGKINEQYIKILDENTAINDGIYTFDIVKDGKPAQVQARYTYVYEMDANGIWKIQVHHSSKMPE